MECQLVSVVKELNFKQAKETVFSSSRTSLFPLKSIKPPFFTKAKTYIGLQNLSDHENWNNDQYRIVLVNITSKLNQ